MKNMKGQEIIKTVISDEFGAQPDKAALFQKIGEQITVEKAQFKPQKTNQNEITVTSAVLAEPVKRHNAIWQTVPAIAALLLIIGGGAMGLHLLSQQSTPPPPPYYTATDFAETTALNTASVTHATPAIPATPATPATPADSPSTLPDSQTEPPALTAPISTDEPGVPTESIPPATTPITPPATTAATTSPPVATNSHGLPIMWVCDGCFRQNCRNEFPEHCGLKIRSCGYCNGLEIPTGFGLPCRCDRIPLEHLINYCMGCGKLTGENEIQDCWPDPCNLGPLLYCHTTGRLMEGCNCYHCEIMRANN